MISETHANAAQRDMLIRDIIARMRHDGCGGRAGQIELLTALTALRPDRCERSCYAPSDAPAAPADFS
jgi:hypothetical protein